MAEGILFVRGWTETPKGPARIEIGIDRESGTLLRGCAPSDAPLPVGSGLLEYDASCRILPGDVNAHSHPEQSVYADLVDPAWDLPTWCRNTIYRHSRELAPEHIYLGCCRAFYRMLLLGVTTAVVSFYCHNRRGNDLDREVIRAARDTGIRLYFGRMHYDRVSKDAYPEKHASQESYFETGTEYESALEGLLSEFSSDPLVAVAPALHSFHANSLEAIAEGIHLGSKVNRMVQFHLSEDRGDVDLCLREYGMRPVEVLDGLVLQGRVAGRSHVLASDGIWSDDREKDLMSSHGMSLVLNPRMNRRIKAGRADLAAYLERGVPVFLGTDGEASNDDLSVEEERRFLADDFPEIDRAVLEGLGRSPFPFPSCPVGCLAPGFAADLKVLQDGKVRDIFVAGKKVVSGGKLANLDPEKDVEGPLKRLLAEW